MFSFFGFQVLAVMITYVMVSYYVMFMTIITASMHMTLTLCIFMNKEKIIIVLYVITNVF